MEPVRLIRSRTVVLAESDIDTDQIFPARFLTTTSDGGFAGMLFADWRVDAAGRPRPEFALNRPEAAGCSVLVAGRTSAAAPRASTRPGPCGTTAFAP